MPQAACRRLLLLLPVLAVCMLSIAAFAADGDAPVPDR